MVLLILGWAFFALVAQIYTCLMKAIVVEVVEAVVTASCDRLRQQLRVRTIYHTIVINIACDVEVEWGLGCKESVPQGLCGIVYCSY